MLLVLVLVIVLGDSGDCLTPIAGSVCGGILGGTNWRGDERGELNREGTIVEISAPVSIE
jgi:hypothetical protein